MTDEIAFMYLTMSHLQGEQLGSARFPAPGPAADRAPLGAAVFPASHPAHAWSFLVGEWADLVVRVGGFGGASSRGGVGSREEGPGGGGGRERSVRKQHPGVEGVSPENILKSSG